MDSMDRARKIIEATNCSLDITKAADRESNVDLEVAIRIARERGNVTYSGGKSGLYLEEPSPTKHITQFKNGVLVGKKFYDFSVGDNVRLKRMLENKTFDLTPMWQRSHTSRG